MKQLDSLKSLSAEEPESLMDLRIYFRLLQKYRWVIILSVLASVSITWWLQSKVSDFYESSVTLAIESADIQSLALNQLQGTTGGSSEFGWQRERYLEQLKSTQIRVLESHDVAERVVKNLNLHTHPEYIHYLNHDSKLDELLYKVHFFLDDALRSAMRSGDRDMEQPQLSEGDLRTLVMALQQRVEVVNLPGSQLVQVVVRSYDPDLAFAIAESYPDAFVDASLEARMKKSAIETQWLNGKVLALKQKLDESVDRLQTFKEQERLVDIEGVNSLASDRIVTLNEELANARREIAELQVELRQIRLVGKNNYEQLSTVPSIAADSLVVAQKSALSIAELRLEESSKRYGALHPRRISAKSEVNATRQALNMAIDAAAKGVETRLKTIRERERELKRELTSEKSDFQLTSRKESRLNTLEQEVQVNRDIFNIFYNRSRQSAESLDLQRFIAQLVDKPIFIDEPMGPRRKLILLVGLLFGFGVGFGVALLLDRFRDTFETAMDVIARLQSPFLGVLPKFPVARKRSEEPQIPYLDVDSRQYAESVRTIRTGVVLSEVNETHKLILVTSATPSEGKSTVSINLAVSLGQVGKRVLLIDADLRRPSIGKVLRIDSNTPGLSNLVAGMSKLDECVMHIEGVDVISAGPIPPNPSELLSSSRFHALIEALKDEYDCIIIDSAPVQAVSDALLIAQQASLVVQVILADVTSVKVAKLTQKRIEAVTGQAPCAILNKVDVSRLTFRKDDLGGYYDYYEYSDSSS